MTLPSQMYLPVIPRPKFDMSRPGQLKRPSVIRGSTRSRCQMCSALLPLNDETCTACGATQISKDLIMETRPEGWIKRLGMIGNVKNGYEGNI